MRVTVLETRASKSRPEIGFVTAQMEMINQDGTRVMALTSPLIFGTRPADAP
jgi:acyl dehydratase